MNSHDIQTGFYDTTSTRAQYPIQKIPGNKVITVVTFKKRGRTYQHPAEQSHLPEPLRPEVDVVETLFLAPTAGKAKKPEK